MIKVLFFPPWFARNPAVAADEGVTASLNCSLGTLLAVLGDQGVWPAGVPVEAGDGQPAAPRLSCDSF